MARFFGYNALRLKDVPVALVRTLANLSDEYFVLLEFQIGVTADIDLAILHRTGIYAIEVKDKAGVVRGSRHAEEWTCEDTDDIHRFKNPYTQAKRYGDALKTFVAQHVSSIQDPAHRLDTYALRVYPQVCFVRWHQGSQVEPDNWVMLAKGPEGVIANLAKRNWTTAPQTSGLHITATECERLTQLLNLHERPARSFLVGRPVWRPRLDRRVSVDLRRSELSALRDHVERNSVLAIVGEPLVGKSSLAQLFGSEAEASGQLVFDHDCRQGGFAIMAERFLSTLEVSPIPLESQDRMFALVDAFVRLPVLAIFDNFESLMRSDEIADRDLSQFIDLLLREPGKGRLLLTSRRRVRTLSQTQILTFALGGLQRTLAVGFVEKEFRFSTELAEQIVSMADGNPHAIFVVASRVGDFAATGLLTNSQLIDVGLSDVGEMLLNDYQHLGERERELLSLASLSPDGFPADLFTRLAGGNDTTDASVAAALIGLHRHGLVSLDTSRGVRLLPLLREYIYRQTPDRQAKHLRVYRIVVGSGLDQPDPVLLSALEHGISAQLFDEVCELLFDNGVAERLEVNGRYASLVSLLNRLRHLPDSAEAPVDVQAKLNSLEGRLRVRMGDVAEGRSLSERAAQCYERSGDRVGRAECLLDLAYAARKTGDIGANEFPFYETALRLLKECGDSSRTNRLRARIISQYARACELAGGLHQKRAEALRLEALALADIEGDDGIASGVLAALADDYRRQGRMEEATRRMEESFVRATRSGDEGRVAHALGTRARFLKASGRLQDARDAMAQVVEMSRSVFPKIDALSSLAEMNDRLGHIQEARRSWRDATLTGIRVGDFRAAATALRLLGESYLRSNEGDIARTACGLAVELMEVVRADPIARARAYLAHGCCIGANSQLAESENWLLMAFHLARQERESGLMLKCCRELGRLYAAAGRADLAVASFDLGLDHQRANGGIGQQRYREIAKQKAITISRLGAPAGDAVLTGKALIISTAAGEAKARETQLPEKRRSLEDIRRALYEFLSKEPAANGSTKESALPLTVACPSCAAVVPLGSATTFAGKPLVCTRCDTRFHISKLYDGQVVAGRPYRPQFLCPACNNARTFVYLKPVRRRYVLCSGCFSCLQLHKDSIEVKSVVTGPKLRTEATERIDDVSLRCPQCFEPRRVVCRGGGKWIYALCERDGLAIAWNDRMAKTKELV